MSTVFREPEQPKEPDAQHPVDNTNTEYVGDYRPVENAQDLLDALGVQDDIRVLPAEDYEDLLELQTYLGGYMEEKGLSQTVKGTQKAIKLLKEDMGLDEEADPQAVIKKIGAISKSYRSLSFIQDVEERRKVLSRLIVANTVKEMDRIIMDEMEKKSVWR